MNRNFYDILSPSKYKEVVKEICKHGKEMLTPTRSVPMYCYGSTMYGGVTPKYVDPNTRDTPMLPRPYVTYRPGEPAWKIINSPWFKDLCSFLMDVVWQHINDLKNIDPQESKRLAKIVVDAINLIHPSLRIGDTCFSQFHAVGDDDHEVEKGAIKGNHVAFHRDRKDLLTLIITLGLVYGRGGATVYYTGENEKKDSGVLSHTSPFVHGRVQIGSFDKVIHGVTAWNGPRVSLNFNLKENTLDHFRVYKDKLYKKYYDAGLPREELVVDWNAETQT